MPNAELIGVCAAFEANEVTIRGIYDDPARQLCDEDAATAAAPFEAKVGPLLDRLDTLRASTSAGVHARARLLYARDPQLGFDWASPGTRSNRLLVALLRDAMGSPVRKALDTTAVHELTGVETAEAPPATFGEAVNRSITANPKMTLPDWGDKTPEGRLVAAAQAMNDDKLLAWVMAAPMGCAP